jgi:hypothetical protein
MPPQPPQTRRPPATVNAASRLTALLAFTVLLLPTAARADRVLLYAVEGQATDERLQEVEAALAAILEAQGHQLVPPRDTGHPTDSAAMAEAAASGPADYVITAEMDPLPGQYRLHLHVFHAESQRLEDLVATVLLENERGRLSDILSSMVRPQGLGDDAIRLTDAEEQAQAEAERLRLEEEARRQAELEAAQAEAERQRQEEEERQRQEAEEAARRHAEEAAEEAQREWEARPRFAEEAPWSVWAGIGGGGAVVTGSTVGPQSGGGGIVDFSVRVGRQLLIDGLELRAGIDGTTGLTSGIGIMAGATWQGSFFTEPVFIGGLVEGGLFLNVTGSRSAAFRFRLGPAASWRPTERVYLEASVTFGYLTAGAGAVELGGTARVGYRF